MNTTYRIAVVVNRTDELHEHQTTWLFCMAALQRGHEVWTVGVDALERDEFGHTLARGRRHTRNSLRGTLHDEWVDLGTCHAVFIRTNPGRDARRTVHLMLLDFLSTLPANVLVLSSPTGLRGAMSKLFLYQLPAQTIPKTRVVNSLNGVRRAIRDMESGAVLKPLDGSQGRGVVRLNETDQNTAAVADLMLAGGPIMIQEYLPESTFGDTRVLLLDGEPLEIEGRIAAVRRIPPAGDFRSNIFVGGTAAPAELTTRQLATLCRIGDVLRRHGLWCVGVDMIGDKIIEANVFSAGGIRDASRFEQRDFATALVVAGEEKIRCHQAANRSERRAETPQPSSRRASNAA